MLEITGLQLLYKQEGFYDAIVGSVQSYHILENKNIANYQSDRPL